RSNWRSSGATAAQRGHGLTSCSEWTGVPLSMLLKECAVKPEGAWILAEGADPGRHDRSIPIVKAMDDVMVAYGQNGEPLRPEQGYPLRLLVPGWEGNVNVKWLRRVKVLDRPAMSREETSKYTDLMPDGTARQFTFYMEAKSRASRSRSTAVNRGRLRSSKRLFCRKRIRASVGRGNGMAAMPCSPRARRTKPATRSRRCSGSSRFGVSTRTITTTGSRCGR